MSRLTLPSLLCASVLLCASISQAVVTEFTWTGRGGNSNVTTPNNWSGGSAPTFSGGAEQLIFPDSGTDQVNFSANSDIYGLTLTGHYHFSGAIFLHLYAGGLTASSTYQTHQAFESNLAVDVAANQTWNIGSNVRVEFYNNAYITGTGQITKTGAGLLDPGSGNSGWTGGLQFNEGTIILRPGSSGTNSDESRSLGTGAVVIGADTTNRPTFEVYNWSYSGSNNDNEVILANNFTLNGVFASRNETELTLDGNLTLNASTTFRLDGDATFVGGAITEAITGASPAGKKLTLDANGALVLEGSSGWTGGTEVTKGILVFAGEDNTPGTTGAIRVGSEGYVGIGVDNNVGGFLAQIDQTNSTGTLGFDSDLETSLDHFTDPIDLTGFNAAVRLGTATAAVLDTGAVITPQGNDYRFGGGGGVLAVASQLTGARNLVLDSPADLPLTVRLINSTNNFTGSTSITNSGLVLGDNLPLPGGTYTLNAGAYVGTEDPDVSAPTLLGHIAANSPGIVGLDIAPNVTTTREYANLSMAGYSAAYFGTSSAVRDVETQDVTAPGLRLTGTLTADNGVHRFAAYKGGALEVAGTLTGTSLIIGHPDSLGAFGDRVREDYSTVLLSGNNAGHLANGVTFYGGRLLVGQATGDGAIGTDHTHALGEGTLTIAPVTFSLQEAEGAETPSPMLGAFADNLIISNPIVVNAEELNLGGDHDFKLTGAISGSGELYVGEESESGFALTLSGNNTFSGGVYVSNSALVRADSDTALGTGTLGFGSSGESDSRVEFSTVAPVIHGLKSNTSSAEIELTNVNSPRLTIIQGDDATYMGALRADSGSTGTGGVFVKEGTGTLRLNDVDVYGYGQGTDSDILEVKQGTLILSDVTFESSSTAIRVTGGTLALDGNRTLNNPVHVDSGRLGGFGTFNSDVTIGSGAILSPGLTGAGSIGTLTIDHLELNAGGTYEWQIRNPDTSGGGRDLVKVGVVNNTTTLVINADSTDRFTLKIISLNLSNTAGGQLANINPEHGLYAWTLFEYDTLQTTLDGDAFDPDAFALDVSQFTTAYGTGQAAGSFSLSLDGQNNRVMLNFTPVPEPSTYALMALGLGFIGLTVWRKRRA